MDGVKTGLLVRRLSSFNTGRERIRVDVSHGPCDVRGIDMIPEIIDDDENLHLCLVVLNDMIKDWPEYPVTIEQVRSLDG